MNTPTYIPPGGYITSIDINNAITDIVESTQNLDDSVTTLAQNIDEFYKRLSLQTLCTTQYLAGIIETPSIANTINIDCHDLSNINIVSNTARHLPEYGIITPQIVSGFENQLCVKDSIGEVLLPVDTKVEYSFDNLVWQEYGTTYLERSKLKTAFDEQLYTAWSIPVDQIVGDVYIRITFPLEILTGALTNAIAIHPQPEFGAKLFSASIYSGGTWSDLTEISCTTPSTADNTVPLPWYAKPELFIFSPRRVQQVLFHYKMPIGLSVDSTRLFSIAHVGAYNLEFASTGTIILDCTTLLDTNVLATIPATANPDTLWMSQPLITRIDSTKLSVEVRKDSSGIPIVLRTLQIQTT